MNTNTKSSNLYLLGFMGSGKSTVGQRVAQQLSMQFLDADREIEKKVGMGVVEVFKNYGEPYFRQLERAFIDNGHPQEGCVIACGGGILTSEGILQQLALRGIPICLLASVTTVFKRTQADLLNPRPLLSGAKSPLERINELLTKRKSLYNAVTLKVVTDDKTVETVAGEVIEIYQMNVYSKKA